MAAIKIFDNVFRFIIKIFEWTASIILMAMAVVGLLNVVCRFVLNIPAPWADEFLRYSSVWMVFILCPVLVIQKGHLMVDMTTMFFPKKLWNPLFALGNLMCLAFVIVLLPSSIRMVLMGTEQVSTAMGIPMSLVYSCVPASLILMALGFLRVAVYELFPAKAPLDNFNIPVIKKDES
jgi:TRAP-type C4-dicarboxylate transport system permease small subunit